MRATRTVFGPLPELDKAMAPPGAGRPQAAFHEAAPVQSAGHDASHLKARAVATTLYLLPDDHRRLRKLAIDEEKSFQSLMLDAVDALLASRGEPPVERWDTRRKAR